LLQGKTTFSFISDGADLYEKRIKRFIDFNIKVLPAPKNAGRLAEEELKLHEGSAILKRINPADYVVLLDENGKALSSRKFASFIQKAMLRSEKHVVFIVGGAYGFSGEVQARANFQLSLSVMTFSHQIIRVLFLEQLYRAFTILRGEPYHHD